MNFIGAIPIYCLFASIATIIEYDMKEYTRTEYYTIVRSLSILLNITHLFVSMLMYLLKSM